MKTALLDVNVLTALLWPAHEHHEAAHRWFAARRRGRWATCPVTQMGVVRLLSNPAFSTDALSPGDALALLAKNLDHPAHEFWSDNLPVPSALHPVGDRLNGHRQIVDAYLLALAVKRRGLLASFDVRIRNVATPQHLGALTILPTS